MKALECVCTWKNNFAELFKMVFTLIELMLAGRAASMLFL